MHGEIVHDQGEGAEKKSPPEYHKAFRGSGIQRNGLVLFLGVQGVVGAAARPVP